jgi:hypothetical protein
MLKVALDENKSLVITPDAVEELVQKAIQEREEIQEQSINELVCSDDYSYFALCEQLLQIKKHNGFLYETLVANIYYHNLKDCFASYDDIELEIIGRKDYSFNIKKIKTKTEEIKSGKRNSEPEIIETKEKERIMFLHCDNGKTTVKYYDPVVLEVAGDTILKLDSVFKHFGWTYIPIINYSDLMFKVK